MKSVRVKLAGVKPGRVVSAGEAVSKRSQAAKRPTELAQSAFELFSRRGIANVNMDDIAAHAKVTKGSLYWHYSSKHDVILAACQCYYQNWHHQVQLELSRLSDPLARLRRILAFSVRSCLLDERNRIFTIEIFGMSLYHPDIRRSWLQFYDTVREFFIGMVLAANSSGRLKVANPRQSVDFMLEAMEGMKLRAMYEPHIGSEAEEVLLVDGLQCIIMELGNIPGPETKSGPAPVRPASKPLRAIKGRKNPLAYW